MGSGFSKMKKQAKLLQQQFEQMQDEMKNLHVIGSSGNGLVEVEMNGDKEVLKVKIKPECVDKDDLEGLEDLIVAAIKNGSEKIKEKSPESSMGSLPFGL
jgi:DNA-binding YbaB/EbfC family protein